MARLVLHTVPRAFVGLLFLAGLVLNVVNVVCRYVLFRPIMSAEEILVYAMIWCIFIGAAIVTFEGSHLRMELIADRLPRAAQSGLRVLAALVFIAIAVVLIGESWAIVGLVGRLDETSVVAGIPMTIPWAALPVSFALMVAALAWRAVVAVRGLRRG